MTDGQPDDVVREQARRFTISDLLVIGLAVVVIAMMTGLIALPLLDVFDGSGFSEEFWENIARLARAATVGLAAILEIVATVGFIVAGPGELVAMISFGAGWIMFLPTWIFVFAGIDLPPEYHGEIRSIGIQPTAIGTIYFVGTFLAMALAFGLARMLEASQAKN